MQAVSPRPSTAAHSSLQQNKSADMTAHRPTMAKRQSSASSHTSKHGALSPGSLSDYQPLRHHVKPAKKGPKVRLPLQQNHGSGRNLVKLAQQAQQAQNLQLMEERRKKAHDGDSEIRLPGSLDEHRMRRNLTATQLPRNTSHTKLKKNLSHGQLTRLALNATTTKGPPSPGLKGRSKRPKSADMSGIEKDLHEREVEIAQEQQEKKDVPKKVGFAVGSYDGVSDKDDLPQMEGSGLQDDEWTDQSASASPYSTRQNTANNSRRASVVIERPTDTRQIAENTEAKDQLPRTQHVRSVSQDVKAKELPKPADDEDESEEDEDDEDDDDEDGDDEDEDDEEEVGEREEKPSNPRISAQLPKVNRAQQVSQQAQPQPSPRSLLQGAKDHPNPAARHLLKRNVSNVAPALVSNISALDDSRSNRSSPAASLISSRSTLVEGGDSGELVSRFMPSASHPSTTSSVPNTNTPNTPKTSGIHTLESESMLSSQRGNEKSKPSSSFSIGPVSPISSRSLSSHSMAAPSRFRNEERMMNEKVMAEKEDAAALQPIVPPHVFDRRNESLKSYLNLAKLSGDGRGGVDPKTGVAMSPEIFTGRFKAVNTELKVVQRFRDPIGESISRLQQSKESDFSKLRPQSASTTATGTMSTSSASGSRTGNAHQKQSPSKMPTSRSAISLPKQSSKLSSSASPPKSSSPVKSALTTAKSTTQIKRQSSGRGKVTFSGAAPETREIERRDEGDGAGSRQPGGADAIAKALWESIGK